MRKGTKIAVVIPAFQVGRLIPEVLKTIPRFVDEIVVVNDCSSDDTYDRISGLKDKRLHIINHEKNQGVGAAVISGYSYALRLGADIVVKVDGDNQMDLNYLPMLIDPIINEKADYSKGNRFLHPVALKKMPMLRRIGNLGLTFLTKLASGYWNIFDPTNGYTAISSEMLLILDPKRLSKGYFFETSMLCELRKMNAVVEDIPIPAVYNEAKSALKISKEVFNFSINLFIRFLKRIIFRYFLYDFNAVSLYLICGTALGLFGGIWGIAKWVHTIQTGIPATTGTVLIAVLPLILGVQFLIQAVALDIEDVPRQKNISNFPRSISDLTNSPMKEYIERSKGVIIVK